MARPYALLRAGFPFVKTLGMRRVVNVPVDVAVGEDGTIYVLCRVPNIVRLPWEDAGDDWDTYLTSSIGGKGAGEGQFTWPVQMLIDRQEHLWVSDEHLHRITVLTTDGEHVRTWASTAVARASWTVRPG